MKLASREHLKENVKSSNADEKRASHGENATYNIKR